MLLALDAVPRLDNLLASFFTWILLAGFVLFPGTFTSLQSFNVDNGNGGLQQVEGRVLDVVQNVSLFVIAWICCGVGAVGMIRLWWKWNANYIWLLDSIFLPGCLNGLAGVITTIANVFGAQGGRFTVNSEATLAVTGACTVICGALTVFYSAWLLRRVKLKHEMEIGRERAGKHGEGLLEEVKRRAQEPEPQARIF